MEHKDERDGNNKPPALKNIITDTFKPSVHHQLLIKGGFEVFG